MFQIYKWKQSSMLFNPGRAGALWPVLGSLCWPVLLSNRETGWRDVTGVGFSSLTCHWMVFCVFKTCCYYKKQPHLIPVILGVSSNLRRSTEGNTKEPAKYLLFLNYLKNGCCRPGEGRSAALRDQSDVGECCWPVVSPVTESQPRSPLPTQSFLFQWSLYAEWHWHL